MKKFVRFLSVTTFIAFASLIGFAIYDLDQERMSFEKRFLEFKKLVSENIESRDENRRHAYEIDQRIIEEEFRILQESIDIDSESSKEEIFQKLAELDAAIYRNTSESEASYRELRDLTQTIAASLTDYERADDPSKAVSDLSPLVQLYCAMSSERPTSDGRGMMSGWKEESLSGAIMLWSGKYYILTVAHGAAPKATCFFADGRPSTQVEKVGWSDKLDVAIYRFENGYTYTGRTFDLGNSGGLELLSPVIALGSPGALTHGGNFSASYGYVMNPSFWSGHHRFSQSSVILHLANINEGASGGPLLDAAGRIVGVNFGTMNQASFTSDTQGNIVKSKLEMNLFLATPIDDVKRILDKLTRGGRARHGQIRGLTLEMSGLLSKRQLENFNLDMPVAAIEFDLTSIYSLFK